MLRASQTEWTRERSVTEVITNNRKQRNPPWTRLRRTSDGGGHICVRYYNVVLIVTPLGVGIQLYRRSARSGAFDTNVDPQF